MNRLSLEGKILKENDRIAAGLRERFCQNGTLCVNLISAPGSGKTSLLENTLRFISSPERTAVLTGDIQTENDADRLRRFSSRVKQITTGGTCHLEAWMIERFLEDWDLGALDYLFIENVGNLVCPSSYDLGEAAKVVLLSVTEGEDKPLKYPSIFFKSELAVITKTDLLPYISFSMAEVEKNARLVHPEMDVVRVSNSSGDGLVPWFDWLHRRRELFRAAIASMPV